MGELWWRSVGSCPRSSSKRSPGFSSLPRHLLELLRTGGIDLRGRKKEKLDHKWGFGSWKGEFGYKKGRI